MTQTPQNSDCEVSEASDAQPDSSPQELSQAVSHTNTDSEVSEDSNAPKEQVKLEKLNGSIGNQKPPNAPLDFNSAASHPSDASAREDRSKKTLQSTPSLESGLKPATKAARAGVPSVFNGAKHQKGYTEALFHQENPQVAPIVLKTAQSDLGSAPDDLNSSNRRSSRVRRKKGDPFEDAPEEEKKSESVSFVKQDSKSLQKTTNDEVVQEGDQKNINNKVKVYKKIRTFNECLQLFKNMNSFDWDQKDIANLKSSPSYQMSKMNFDEALQTLLNSLKDSVPKGEDIEKESPEVTQLFRSLIQQDGRLKAIFKLYMQQSMEDGLKKKEGPESDRENEDLIHEEEQTPVVPQTEDAKLQMMIKFIEKELRLLEKENDAQLRCNHKRLQEAFQNPVEETICYRSEDMESYPNEFLGQINKLYAADMEENYDWYLENTSEIILNSTYPSKLEKEFLKHIELQQQKKNDLTYKKLMVEIEKNRKGNSVISEVFFQEQQRLSTQRQQQIAHEDAQCAICNSGDYEDEDLIVFCGLCNVPVHQSCYGIDQIPENDWICYSCEIFTQSRGFCVNCFMCSKKGGAMKPTNLLNPDYNEPLKLEDQSSVTKKKTKKTYKSLHKESSSLFYDIEDKTCSLHNVLLKEQQFQSDLRVNNIDKYEIDLPLNYEGQEKENQIPDDYAIFFHRNEKIIQESSNPATKYHWVHLSCASWIPGISVTPKTPIKFTSKMEKKRFDLRCIICLKKQGACIQCQHSKCQISFHIECARRSGYFMEIEKKGNLIADKHFKIFCEKHRPLKIVKEMQERDQKILEEIFTFCRTIEKCTEIEQRNAIRSQMKEPKQSRKQEVVQTTGHSKKWREKDKKYLLDQVRYYFLQTRKLRLSVIKMKPKCKKRVEKETTKKYKKQLKFHIQKTQGGLRKGLRSANNDISDAPNEIKINKEEIEIIQKLSQEQVDQTPTTPIQEQEQEMEIEIEEVNRNETSPLQIEQVMEEEAKEQAEQKKSKNEKKEEELNQKTTYKMLNLPFPQLDWALTLSQNDFPWYAVCFGNFSAKECYEKYTWLVKDQETFFKKVLLQKAKYAKVLLQPTLPVIYTSYQIDEPEAEETLYCYCKNQSNTKDSIFVFCDGGEDLCPNNGWVHHNCDEELSKKSQNDLDSIKEFFCKDCKLRIEDPESYAKLHQKKENKIEKEMSEEGKSEEENMEDSDVSAVPEMESDKDIESEKEDDTDQNMETEKEDENEESDQESGQEEAQE